jgi:hypothetical protein
MHRIFRGFIIKAVILGIFFGCFLFFSPDAARAGGSPEFSGKYEGYNLVLIILDALRPDRLGCYGYPEKVSPNIDALADKSVLFTNAFSASAYTLPAVTSIFTSLYPCAHNVMDVLKDRLPDNILTLAQVMNGQGYNTGWFGSVYDPHSGSAPGLLNGFKSISELSPFGGCGQIRDWINLNSRDKFFLTVHSYLPHELTFPFCRADNRFSRLVSDEFKSGLDDLRQRWWDELRNMLNEDPERIYPALGKIWVECNMSLFMHIPAELDASRKKRWENVARTMLKKYPEKVYRWAGKRLVEKKNILLRPKPVPLAGGVDGMWVNSFYDYINSLNKKQLREFLRLLDSAIYEADEKLVGGIVEELKARGVYDRTIIVITADHGNEYKEHGHVGHGRYLYDESIHVPLIYYLPGLNKGMRIDLLAQSIDILPTILGLLSIPVPAQAQGMSLVGLLENKKGVAVNEVVFSQGTDGIRSLRSVKWKYIRERDDLRDGREKAAEYIFDLRKDKGEKNNLRGSRPKIAEMLRGRLDSLIKGLRKYNNGKREFLPGISEEMREKIRKSGYW